jgi:hypothetical protein
MHTPTVAGAILKVRQYWYGCESGFPRGRKSESLNILGLVCNLHIKVTRVDNVRMEAHTI